MISRAALLLLLLVLSAAFSAAGEIREFNVATLQRLGSELIRASQQADRGATDPVRKQARQTAMAALQGKLFDTHYDYVVLNDPDGSGFLVYALAATQESDEFILAGHFRVTVSAAGTKAERVDALSRSLLSSGPIKSASATGDEAVALYLIQLVSNKPVETLIYTSHLAKKPIYVRTPDGKTWEVGEGKMRAVKSKASNKP
jgi:hypothetical protein